jgi:hypothetical protein
MLTPEYGEIYDFAVYHTSALMKRFGIAQDRTLHEWLDEMGVRWRRAPKGGRLYSGSDIPLGIQGASETTEGHHAAKQGSRG